MTFTTSRSGSGSRLSILRMRIRKAIAGTTETRRTASVYMGVIIRHAVKGGQLHLPVEMELTLLFFVLILYQVDLNWRV
jgi:hypothetical protein